MKYSSAVLLAASGLAMANKHVHRHQHAHAVRREASPVDVYVPGATVIVYELNGQSITEAEVLQGIANGTLVWGQGGEVEPAAPVSTPVELPEVNQAKVYNPPAESSKEPEKPQETEQPKQEEEPKKEEQQPKQQTSSPTYESDGNFPDYDDSLSCDEFPSAFGAVPLDYLGLNGWAGIQDPKSNSDAGYDNIFTFVAGMLGLGDKHEGAYYSYACPVGYQSIQWPAKQGATLQSIGGLRCEGGKLKLTRGDVTKKLCDAGTDKVTIKVKNTMTDGAAICRTNYPGPEDETIPTWVSAGSEAKLACPDADNFYEWNGGKTSAQLYVNPRGVSAEEGCQWGEAGKPIGNWAPLNLGVGFSDGMAWIAIFQNSPTTNEKLDFSIEIQGDGVNGKCKYDANIQKYCDEKGCNDQGCTSAVSPGSTAYYVLS